MQHLAKSKWPPKSTEVHWNTACHVLGKKEVLPRVKLRTPHVGAEKITMKRKHCLWEVALLNEVMHVAHLPRQQLKGWIPWQMFPLSTHYPGQLGILVVAAAWKLAALVKQCIYSVPIATCSLVMKEWNHRDPVLCHLTPCYASKFSNLAPPHLAIYRAQLRPPSRHPFCYCNRCWLSVLCTTWPA